MHGAPWNTGARSVVQVPPESSYGGEPAQLASDATEPPLNTSTKRRRRQEVERLFISCAFVLTSTNLQRTCSGQHGVALAC
mmetsp:Transcript_516/g.1866  ORF Transcript_516/g.1866 Transcript_516/m.1866 type:complete len:81 (-) Transcript_516:19-261(-)